MLARSIPAESPQARIAFTALPYQRFGRCSQCLDVSTDDGRPLWLGGRVNGALICFRCFLARGRAPGRRRAA
jgi:hypothetical protein